MTFQIRIRTKLGTAIVFNINRHLYLPTDPYNRSSTILLWLCYMYLIILHNLNVQIQCITFTVIKPIYNSVTFTNMYKHISRTTRFFLFKKSKGSISRRMSWIKWVVDEGLSFSNYSSSKDLKSG